MESNKINDIVQPTAELSIEDDKNDILKSTESTFEEYSEDDDEGIMELKVCTNFLYIDYIFKNTNIFFYFANLFVSLVAKN